MTLIVLLFLLVLAISFFCSLLEAVFLSITPVYVSMEQKEGHKHGILLERLKENIDRPLAAILTLNTISHTAGSSAIGAMVNELYGNSALTAASIVLTLGVLILSEILPKIIGATYWRSFAPFATYSIQLLIFILYPIVRLSELLGKMFSRPDEATVTREDMIANAEIGVDEGTLHSKESKVIKNLLMLNKLYVSDIMTPRSVFFAMEASMTVEEVAAKYRPIRFSRIPVFQTNLDNIIGMTHRYKILEALSHDLHHTSIKEVTTTINTVAERMTVSAAIEFFVKQKEHLALAVDEYGIVTGLVTLEDAIETLLGVEIVDEFDNITDMRQYALEQWQIRKNQIRKT
jgi:CBS domain containing-hemolysin-like protein